MINPVTLEKTDTTEITVTLDKWATNRMQELVAHTGYTVDQIVDYAIIDYHIEKIGKMIGIREDVKLTHDRIDK